MLREYSRNFERIFLISTFLRPKDFSFSYFSDILFFIFNAIDKTVCKYECVDSFFENLPYNLP